MKVLRAHLVHLVKLMKKNSLKIFALGLCGGLVMAAGILLMMRPSPTISLPYNALSSGNFFTKEIPYNRVSPLPKVEIVNDDGSNVLHTAVRRVRLRSGQEGIRILVLKKEDKKEWI